MQAGYSTAPEWIRELGFGAGMGLVNIKKCADEMHLGSTPGAGTRLEILIWMHQDGANGEEKLQKSFFSEEKRGDTG